MPWPPAGVRDAWTRIWVGVQEKLEPAGVVDVMDLTPPTTTFRNANIALVGAQGGNTSIAALNIPDDGPYELKWSIAYENSAAAVGASERNITFLCQIGEFTDAGFQVLWESPIAMLTGQRVDVVKRTVLKKRAGPAVGGTLGPGMRIFLVTQIVNATALLNVCETASPILQ